MPPRRKAAMRGDKRESRERLVEEDDSDGGGDDLTAIDDDAERQKRRKDKLRERGEHVVQVAQLRKEGMQVLRAAGMRQLETEGVGDCWLIALLAGHELDAGNIQHFSPEQRQALLTPWRLDGKLVHCDAREESDRQGGVSSPL